MMTNMPSFLARSGAGTVDAGKSQFPTFPKVLNPKEDPNIHDDVLGFVD
jgi:hypothetical protein